MPILSLMRNLTGNTYADFIMGEEWLKRIDSVTIGHAVIIFSW